MDLCFFCELYTVPSFMVQSDVLPVEMWVGIKVFSNKLLESLYVVPGAAGIVLDY